MNTYEIEGKQYKATNEYNAVKEAYKLADVWNMLSYDEDEESWIYEAVFHSGKAKVKVKKIKEEEVIKQIMSEQNRDKEGKYFPNYKLLKGIDEESQKYIDGMKKSNIGFAWKYICIKKMKCGHYEVFQSPYDEFHFESSQKCTRCICGW